MKALLALLGIGGIAVLARALRSAPASAEEPVLSSGDGAGRVIDAGVASWYPPTGNPTANGEPYDGTEMTAAHKHLPFNTIVEVVDVDSGKSVIVRINDRGPFVAGRVIDLSPAAAEELGFKAAGLAHVQVLST